MPDLLLVGAAGFAASMVDGALGMGFGPTSSSILLGGGLAPAAVSATVNIAKVAAGAAAGISHWRFRNIDPRLVARLAIPGCLGALVGVTVLGNVDGDRLRPWLALLLIAVGARILFRFRRPLPTRADSTDAASGVIERPDAEQLRGVEVAGAAGGLTNGLIGAWGPVVTPFLLHRSVAPRIAIGSVNTAEVAVAATAAGSLISTIGGGGLDVGVVLAMLIGGVVAAPLAAWIVRFLPPRGMGVAVGGLLLLTNARELANWGDLGASRWLAYGAVTAVTAMAAAAPRFVRPFADRTEAMA